jgi:hypothetical protein
MTIGRKGEAGTRRRHGLMAKPGSANSGSKVIAPTAILVASSIPWKAMRQSHEVRVHAYTSAAVAVSTDIDQDETQFPATDHSHWNNESGGQSQNFHKTRPCTYFAQGTCRRGDSCTYIHDQSGKDDTMAKNPAAKHCVFHASGQCKKGDTCPFIHSFSSTSPRSSRQPAQVWVDVDPVASPIIANRSSVVNHVAPTYCQFHANGKCARGDACPFAHVAASSKFTLDSDSELVRVCRQDSLGRCSRGDACPFPHIQGRREQVTTAPREGTEHHRYPGFVPSIRRDESYFQPRSLSIVTTGSMPSTPCQFFKRGFCARGLECPFLHVPTESTTYVPHSSSPLGSIFPNRDSRQVARYGDMSGVRYQRNAEGTIQAQPVDEKPLKDWPPSPPPRALSPVHPEPTRVSQPSSVDRRFLDSRPASQAMSKTDSRSSSDHHSVRGKPPRNQHCYQERYFENQPDEEAQGYEDTGLTSKVCEFWEQGSCIQGAACPLLHNNPAWFGAVEV